MIVATRWANNQLQMGKPTPESRIITPQLPICFLAIYRAYNPIYNWIRGPPCSGEKLDRGPANDLGYESSNCNNVNPPGIAFAYNIDFNIYVVPDLFDEPTCVVSSSM